MRKLKFYFLAVLFCIVSTSGFSQDFLTQPNPPRLVNDFAALLTSEQLQSLESKLVAYNDSTSTQITIVTVKDLKGIDIDDAAYQIGHNWGVGQKGKNNGIVILVKPKQKDSRGETSIQVGYGLEAVITDALCRGIIENEMIPHFKYDEYYDGLVAASEAIILASKGQYTNEPKTSEGTWLLASIFIGIFVIIIIIVIINNRGPRRSYSSHSISSTPSPYKDLPFWAAVGAAVAAGRSAAKSNSHSSWSSFSSGSDSFGGFGGGDFGGGGASGSW